MMRKRALLAVLVSFTLQMTVVSTPVAHAVGDSQKPRATQSQNDVTVTVQEGEKGAVSVDGGHGGGGGGAGYVPPYPYGATPNHPNFAQWQAGVASCPEDGNIQTCMAQFNDLLMPTGGGTYAPPTRAQVEGAVRESVLRMRLPTPTPRIGPDPSANEWKKAVVGYPLWLWVDGPRTMAASSRDYGIAIRLDATLRDVVFDLGDGNSLRCTQFTPYPAATTPGTPSPTCGHAYQVEPKSGSCTVTGTATWDVQWSALGYSGTLAARVDDAIVLPVTSLQAVVVR